MSKSLSTQWMLQYITRTNIFQHLWAKKLVLHRFYNNITVAETFGFVDKLIQIA